MTARCPLGRMDSYKGEHYQVVIPASDFSYEESHVQAGEEEQSREPEERPDKNRVVVTAVDIWGQECNQ